MNNFTMDNDQVDFITMVFDRLFTSTTSRQRMRYRFICTSRRPKAKVQVIDPGTFDGLKSIDCDWVTDPTRQHYYPRITFSQVYGLMQYEPQTTTPN